MDIDEKVSYFSNTLFNVINTLIPHGTIACGHKDPPWTNNEIKKLMVEKNKGYNCYCHFNRNTFFFEKFKVLQNQLNMSIEDSSKFTTLNVNYYPISALVRNNIAHYQKRF